MQAKTKEKFDRALGTVSKLGTQRHLTAMRDGFALGIPVTIAGAIAIFFITIVFGGWGASKTSLIGLLAHASGGTKVILGNLTNGQDNWVLVGNWAKLQTYGATLFGWVNAATLGSLSIYVSLLISYSMAVIRRHKNPVLVAIFGLATFMAFTGADTSYYSAQGMIVSIIAALAGSELFILLSKNNKLEIKLPPSVPPAVGRGFGILLPGFLTVLAAASLNVLISLPFIWMEYFKGAAAFKTIAWVIITFVQQPFINIAKNGADTGILFAYIFGVGFLWFFGIHGTNTLNGMFGPIAALLWIDNLSGGTNVFTGGVYNWFAFIGGTGGTLPLIILALWLLPKGSPVKEVSKFALPVGTFQVNEPVLFGYPIIFSPKWLIPFVFGPMLAVIWPVIAIKGGWMNPETIPAPWTSPAPIGALISTQFDWRAIIVWLLSFGTLLAIYTPFILWQRLDDRKLMIEEAAEAKKAEKATTKKRGVKA